MKTILRSGWFLGGFGLGLVVLIAFTTGQRLADGTAPAAPAATAAPTIVTQPSTTSTTERRPTLHEWVIGNSATLSAVGDAFDSMYEASVAGNPFAYGDACAELGRAAAAARRTAIPGPTATIEREYGAALDDFEEAADLCVRSVDGEGLYLLDEASRLIDSGGDHIEAVSEVLEQELRSL